MPLVNCPECGKKVSDSARVCAHCGFVLKKRCLVSQVYGHPMILPVMLLFCVAVIFLVIFCTATLNVNSNNGFINLYSNKRGIFPRLRFNCRCNCGGKR